MLDRNEDQVRWGITHEFARWTTDSALSGFKRQGNKGFYVSDALNVVDFDPLFDTNLGPIGNSEFMQWHKEAVSKLMAWDKRLSYGWAAKIIAVYLKTTCYLAGFGREGLSDVIHPPIDNKLMDSLKRESWKSSMINRPLLLFASISKTNEIAYRGFLKAFELIAKERNSTLFEVEQFWRP